jgi:hypothetical protein
MSAADLLRLLPRAASAAAACSPYGFMDRFDSQHVSNGSDDGARYTYEAQVKMKLKPPATWGWAASEGT